MNTTLQAVVLVLGDNISLGKAALVRASMASVTSVPATTMSLLTMRPAAPPAALSAFGPLARFVCELQSKSEMAIDRAEGLAHAGKRGRLQVRVTDEDLRTFEKSCCVHVKQQCVDQ